MRLLIDHLIDSSSYALLIFISFLLFVESAVVTSPSLCILQMVFYNYKVKCFFFPSLGVEARGFIFGPSIALAIGAKFVPLRKPKKLPGMLLYADSSIFKANDVSS